MGLFNKYLLNILILSQSITLVVGSNIISEISYMDYSFLKNKESQFSLGYKSSGMYDYSIDKFISDNLIASAKVSIIDFEQFQLINQLTFKLLNKKYPLSLFLGYNHFYTDSKLYGWINFSPFLELVYRNKYLSAFGINYNLSDSNLIDNSVRYLCQFKTMLSQKMSISIGVNFNPKTVFINRIIELNIEI